MTPLGSRRTELTASMDKPSLLTLFVLACCSLTAAWSTPKDACLFAISSSSTPGLCDSYDLSQLASMGPQTLENVDGYTYIMNLCGNIPDSMIPKQCAHLNSTFGPAVAYQYNNTDCYPLGKPESKFVFPYDPTNSSAGVRVVYGKGAPSNTTSSPWDRAIMFDLSCNSAAIDNKPFVVLEFPPFTYLVRWPSSVACPDVKVEGLNCTPPTFDGTWGMVRYRPKPSWYDKAKFGIFIHWGIFSVPAFKNEWYWKNLMDGEPDYVEFHNKNYGCSGVMPDKFPCTGPSFTYPDFAPMFNAELFQPDQWANLFKQAGAKYVVLTSKHHEGWCNFPSSYHWNWNSVDSGPKRDLVGDLTTSVRAVGLHMGLYHSLREWYNPLYEEDNKNNCSNPQFPDEVLLPTLHEMVEKYQPEVIWGDGDGDAQCTQDSIKYWKSPQFLSWLYNDSPVKNTVMANSRWGTPAFGDYETGGDRFTPGKLLPYKWESCYTIQKSSFGYDRTEGIDQFWNTTALLQQLVSTVSCGGNLLLNVGPTAAGRIIPAFEERLLEMGEWLNINGEAIYETTHWRVQNDTAAKEIWYTASYVESFNNPVVYAISFKAPTPGLDFVLEAPKSTNNTSIYLLGNGGGTLSFKQQSDGLHIMVPVIPLGSLKHAWVFKLMNVN